MARWPARGQIQGKFGAEAAVACRERIEQADADTLLQWSQRILAAERIEDVLH